MTMLLKNARESNEHGELLHNAVSLSAIRALVQQWREPTDPLDPWEQGYEAGHQACAKDLAALCPAPHEET